MPLETCMVFVIPRPSKVISQRLAPFYPWHPFGPGPVGAHPLQIPSPCSPLPSSPSQPGSRRRRPWALPPPSGSRSRVFGPLAPPPPPPPKSPLRPNLQTLLAGPPCPPSPPRAHSAQQPPARFTGPARSRPPPLATGEPRRESGSALRPIPDPRALRSPCGPPLRRLSSPAAFQRSLSVLPSSVPPGRRVPKPFRRLVLRPPTSRLRTSGSLLQPLPPPAAPSRPLASLCRAPWDGRTELGSGGLRPP